MSQFYTAECQVMPGNGVISLTLTPVDENDGTSYEIECPIEKGVVDSFLRKLGCMKDEENPLQFDDIMPDDGVHSFDVAQPMLASILSDFNVGDSDPSGDINDLDIVIAESIKLNKSLYINKRVYEAGSRLKFYYKGSM